MRGSLQKLSEYIIYVIPSRCVGCKSCEIACAVEHSASKDLLTAILESPKPKSRVKVTPADNFYVPMRCMHCEDAPCVAVCPTGAMQKTSEGYVICDPLTCIGCRACVIACPFGHPIYDPLVKSTIKCDHCLDRVREGVPPACVEACPTGALRYGKTEEVLAEMAKKKAEEFITGLGGGGVIYKPLEREAPESPIQKIREAYKPVRWW